MEYLLGIDLGTSSLKTVLIDHNGNVAASSTQTYPILSPAPGYSEQRTDDWLAALERGIRALGSRNIAAIGITGQMHGLVAVNDEGSPIGNAVLWSDRRCDREVRLLEETFPTDQWVRMTGSRPNVSFTLGKILWMRSHEPERFSMVSCLLQPKDYIRFWLTGEKATDESDASATLLFDLQEKTWSEPIVKACQIDRHLLPPILSSTSIAGKLTEAAALRLGLRPGIPVVCGGGDAECQAIGNGVVKPSDWLCTIGTSGQIFTPVQQPVMDPEGRIHTLCHAVPGLWHVMGATLSAGLSLQWLTQRVFRLEEEKGYDWLLEEARLSPPGANGILYLPYLLGERTPHMDDTATGAFLGLQFDHTRSDMVRAVLEGVLFSLLQAKDVIKSLGISSPNRLVMTGGASENALWRKLAADIFGIPVGRCTSRSGAAYGAAILASVGAGWFSDVSDAADSWVSVTDLVEPQLQYKSVYNEYYSMYKDAYPVLRHLYGKHRRNH